MAKRPDGPTFIATFAEVRSPAQHITGGGYRIVLDIPDTDAKAANKAYEDLREHVFMVALVPVKQ